MSPLLAARLQMAFTLGFHIVFASLGVGFPVLLLAAEGLHLRSGDPGWKTLARRWAKAFAVLFAVGAVSGTVLSFELGLLWPEFMGRFGSVIGLPFTLEGFAFFLEAIFLGIYLYGWDRLSPRAHWLSGVPIAIAGAASAWFVVTANAWMNAPQGFRMAGGKVVDPEPFEAMMNPATGAETAHMIVAAYLVTGFVVAACYSWAILRGRGDLHHRRGLALSLAMGVAAAIPQAATGHRAGQMVARTQPVKFAALEGQFRTERGAPIRLGGLPDPETGETRWAIEVPGALAWLAHGDPDAEVRGLEDFPREEWPPVRVVHLAFQAMVGIGSALVLLSAGVLAFVAVRRRLPASRTFLRAVVAAGPLAVLALEAGWTVTEVGRQPWIVHGHMRTADAVTTAPGILWTFLGGVAIYAVLAVGCVAVLRLLARVPLSGEGHGT